MPTADWLRARLAAPDIEDNAVCDQGASAAAWSPAWQDDAELATAAALIPAAVLVPIVIGPHPGVLLTKRAADLRRHAGQVSFPGGRIDATDASPEAAALREAWEEVGLDSGGVEIIGRLRDYVTGTGYRITPILALLQPGYATRLAAAEVDSIFELPMATLLDPHAPERRATEYQGKLRHYWVWPHPEHYIWGATAAILVHLAHRLRAP
jgi:8-oxo-dGTP pyrophosphatase MutT (NUDIX family)